MTAHPAPRPSRRERPAKPALTREGIIGTAVALMRAEGLRRVTMRRLAQELDTGPASLYVYVRDTAELHAAVLDELLGAVDLGPARADGDWRDRLVQVLTSYTAVLFEHPGLARSALVSRPFGDRYLDLLDALLSLMDEGGIPRARAAWAVDLLLQFATATAAEYAPGEKNAVDSQGDSEGEWAALAAALHGASGERHPHVTAAGAELLSGPGEARMHWGFQVLISGILHTPRHGPSDTPRPSLPKE
ncbi:TetR/AcrR family transcriptional regulator [Streptomyces sp. NBC_01571]|uniref:TetR/AcrR family transcriptional regulator n=1 Tax=Streptomyces sp. NBC_01571 TaxID=2975883 RepID=UPI002258B3FD|nr:TetR/AcrR family transcriptional regulator [Streptomyces sp. NBC_01571]MCX4579767.1 TetR/AcrR family transcriptional regulator [Streptomyces sp. NBC_01571]